VLSCARAQQSIASQSNLQQHLLEKDASGRRPVKEKDGYSSGRMLRFSGAWNVQQAQDKLEPKPEDISEPLHSTVSWSL
jgi:hypothetical protein